MPYRRTKLSACLALVFPFIADLPLAKILRFAGVGFSLMGLHIGLGLVLTQVCLMASLPASLLSYGLTACTGYLAHRLITFRSATAHAKSVPRFMIVTAFGFAVATALHALVVSTWGYPAIAGIIATAMVVPFANYVLFDRLVFPDQR